jgi:hypothetical protein
MQRAWLLVSSVAAAMIWALVDRELMFTSLVCSGSSYDCLESTLGDRRNDLAAGVRRTMQIVSC